MWSETTRATGEKKRGDGRGRGKAQGDGTVLLEENVPESYV